MTEPRVFHCATEADSEAAGREIASLLPQIALVHLIGELGAGKTFLVRAIATALGADREEVSSPTFALVHEYPRKSDPPIIHIDAYRLSENSREWMEIGIPELLASETLRFVEWPKSGFADMGPDAFTIEIRVLEDASREITFTPPETSRQDQAVSPD